MKKNTNEASLEMDVDTYNKIRGKLKPNDKVELTDKKKTNSSMVSPNTNSMVSMMEDNEVYTSTNGIKFLSNVQDKNTNEISKPFTINAKNYQLVRGTTPSGEIVNGIFCYDDLDENGENIIHPIDYFEENIAKKFIKQPKEKNMFENPNAFIDHLNLNDAGDSKHFFVNKKNGKISAMFKNTKDMVVSGKKLGVDEEYTDRKGLKKLRFNQYFNDSIDEQDGENSNNDNVNVDKLQSDVKKLTKLIKNRFAGYLSKLDKPIEQAQFLTAMAAEIGVPLNKLSTIINDYRDISQQGNYSTLNPSMNVQSESIIISKNALEESLNIPKQTSRIIKVKELRK